MLATLKSRARRLKTELTALYYAYHHPQVPWYARLWVAVVVGYALSPIDLIPDFIPVLGYLDDLILLPLGIALAIRLIPAAVLAECRARAVAEPFRRPNRLAAGVIVVVWIGLAVLAWRMFSS